MEERTGGSRLFSGNPMIPILADVLSCLSSEDYEPRVVWFGVEIAFGLDTTEDGYRGGRVECRGALPS